MHFRRDYEDYKHINLQVFKKTNLPSHVLHNRRKNRSMFENMRKMEAGVMG